MALAFFGRGDIFTVMIVFGTVGIAAQQSGEKPQFVYPNQMKAIKSNYDEGETFILTCEAIGNPVPVVTWYKDGKEFTGRVGILIKPRQYDYNISFCGVNLEDEGNYTCVVSNSVGQLTYSYKFNVKMKIRSRPKIVHIWEQLGPVYVGSDVELSCKILTKDLNTKYRWYYNPSSVPNEKELGTLINQNRNILKRLNPNVDSWPKWKLTLKLTNLTAANSGIYWCQAENVVGSNKWYTSLNVTNRPITPSATGIPDTKGRRGKEPENKLSGTRFQYLELSIAILVGAVVLMIVILSLCHWKIKKNRAQSSAANGRRSVIDSLRARYEVQNEYVVVPDFN